MYNSTTIDAIAYCVRTRTMIIHQGGIHVPQQAGDHLCHKTDNKSGVHLLSHVIFPALEAFIEIDGREEENKKTNKSQDHRPIADAHMSILMNVR